MHRALYRKYRPKLFEDVVGQEHITSVIKNQIKNKSIAHAYLFTGSHGTGKTTCARLVAKAVNCKVGTDGEPCNECEICIGIDNGSIPDITEIDAASNNGVDDVRELREEAAYTPVLTDYRVYIIDETHMLTPNAFNALLKIMEEPPEHIIFVLATTEAHKILPTVLSRCQRYDFKPIQDDIIADRLEYVSAKEGISINREAALYIAKLSRGGMRDALSLLDVCSAKHENVDMEALRLAVGIVDRSDISAIAEAILSLDTAQVLLALENVYLKAIDAQRLTAQLIEYFRDMMIVKSVSRPEQFLDANADISTLTSQSENCNLNRIFEIITALGVALDEMSRTSMVKIKLESTLVKLCAQKALTTEQGTDKDYAQIKERLYALEQNKPTPTTTKRANAPEKTAVVEVSQKERKMAKPFPKWAEVLEALKTVNPALHGALNGSLAYTCADILLIDCKSDLFLSLIRDNEYARNSLRKAAMEISGTRFKLGPYKEEEYKIETQDAIDDILNMVTGSDVEVEIK